jgi:hypothetical protein
MEIRHGTLRGFDAGTYKATVEIAGSIAVWLSGVHAAAVTQVGAEVKLAPTADQIAAARLGRDTAVASLGMELEPPAVFNCEGGTCIFSNTLSWKDTTTPVPMEAQPRAVFEQLFGEGGTIDQRREEAKWRASILDSVTHEIAFFKKDLGAGDLIFFSTIARGASHVGIALGPDQPGLFVHAPGTGGAVRVERYDSSYWHDRIVGVRRLLY